MNIEDWALLETGREICSDSDFRLVDIGDGVLGFEITSKHQTLTIGLSNGLLRATNYLNNNNDYIGMVIVSPIGKNFCVGANLLKVAEDYNAGDLMHTVDDMILCQTAYMGIKYSRKPIVVAPAKRALGGGAELCLAAAKIVAAPNFMIGLVEANIGLIPGGGGCKELLLRFYELENQDVSEAAKRAFKVISKSFVSKDAENAKEIGYLKASDISDADSQNLIEAGKKSVIELAQNGYKAPERQEVHLAPVDVYNEIVSELEQKKNDSVIGEHEFYVASRIAKVLTSSESQEEIVSEYDILENERMTFYHLASTDKTYARVEHMLKTGEKLNN